MVCFDECYMLNCLRTTLTLFSLLRFACVVGRIMALKNARMLFQEPVIMLPYMTIGTNSTGAQPNHMIPWRQMPFSGCGHRGKWQKNGQNSARWEGLDPLYLLWRWRKKPWTKKCGGSPDDGKGKVTASPQSFQEELQPSWRLDFGLVRPMLDFWSTELWNTFEWLRWLHLLYQPRKTNTLCYIFSHSFTFNLLVSLNLRVFFLIDNIYLDLALLKSSLIICLLIGVFRSFTFTFNLSIWLDLNIPFCYFIVCLICFLFFLTFSYLLFNWVFSGTPFYLHHWLIDTTCSFFI